MHPSEFPSGEETVAGVYFYAEGIDFHLDDEPACTIWIEQLLSRENGQLHTLNYIFCSDDYLLGIHQQFLGKDTYTDIITFPYSPFPVVEGDVFISIPRVRENAETYAVPFGQELCRVMAHGVLHLCGYGDKSDEEKAEMRRKEDECLALIHGQWPKPEID